MRYTISNDFLTVEIDSMGAEIKSVKDKSGKEFMWNADPAFWNRTSPVLFPFVGMVADGKYRHEGKEYSMTQHGFARDYEHEVLSKDPDKIFFTFKGNEKTAELYPFKYDFVCGYALNKNSVEVVWQVGNTDDKDMYFSVGAHPAFFCPLGADGTLKGYSLKFDAKDSLKARLFDDPKGLATNMIKEWKLDSEGKLALDEHTFDEGVLIFENDQFHEVSLVNAEGKEFVTVSFKAPLIGIWSPVKKNAPFVCLEPWYGRCDTVGYDGELKDRDYEQKLSAGGKFMAMYTIKFNS